MQAHFLDSFPTTTTNKATTTTPITAQIHIPPPVHPAIWFIIKLLSVRCEQRATGSSGPLVLRFLCCHDVRRGTPALIARLRKHWRRNFQGANTRVCFEADSLAMG